MGHRTVSVVLVFGRFPERLYLKCVKSDEPLASEFILTLTVVTSSGWLNKWLK